MQITNTNNQFRVANGSDIEFYSFDQVKAVSWRKDSVTSNYILLVYFTANDLDNPAEFDLTKITNQSGWTNNAAGIQQAVADVSGWMSTSSGSATLTSILASLQAGREFESRLVKDASSVIWNEIRYMDTDTGTFTVEYRNAAGATGTPTGSVTFVESTATLASILTKNTEIEVTADAILAKNTEIETSADAILAKNTEIETTADAILAKNTEIETTANAIETLNTSILADTAAIDSAVNGSRTAGIARVTNSSHVGTLSGATNVYSASFYNAHASANATVVGATLKPGETVNFDAGGNGCYFTASALTYDGSSGDLVVTYVK